MLYKIRHVCYLREVNLFSYIEIIECYLGGIVA